MDKTLLKKAFAEMFGSCVLVMIAWGVAVSTFLYKFLFDGKEETKSEESTPEETE